MTVPPNNNSYRAFENLLKGDILLWKRYRFENGNTKSKYILILSSCINNKYYIYTLPTSHLFFYKNSRNRIDVVFLSRKEVKFLPLGTAIDLKHIRTERASIISIRMEDNILVKIGRLPKSIINRIDYAVDNSKTLSPEQQKFILGD